MQRPPLRVLHFNDVYELPPAAKEPIGGVARFASLVERLRASPLEGAGATSPPPPCLTLFSGDCLSPSLLSTITRGKHMSRVLGGLGVDAACLGNHDLDYGVPAFEAVRASMARGGEDGSCKRCPWLCSNARSAADGAPLAGCAEYAILDPAPGWRVGVLGLIEADWIVTLAALDPSAVAYEDFEAACERLVPLLRQQHGCNLVIALTHMREPNDAKLSAAGRRLGLDLILGGHDHSYVSPSTASVTPGESATPLVKSGSDFRNLSEIIVLPPEAAPDGGEGLLAAAATGSLRATPPGAGAAPFTRSPAGSCVSPPSAPAVCVTRYDITAAEPEAPAMASLVSEYASLVGRKMDAVIGLTRLPLDARFAALRTQETGLGNFVADLMRQAVDADVAILNSGTIRADAVLGPGLLRLRDLVACLPMQDSVVKLRVPGRVLRLALEAAVSKWPAKEGRFPQVSGLKFAFDGSAAPGARIVPGSIMTLARRGRRGGGGGGGSSAAVPVAAAAPSPFGGSAAAAGASDDTPTPRGEAVALQQTSAATNDACPHASPSSAALNSLLTAPVPSALDEGGYLHHVESVQALPRRGLGGMSASAAGGWGLSGGEGEEEGCGGDTEALGAPLEDDDSAAGHYGYSAAAPAPAPAGAPAAAATRTVAASEHDEEEDGGEWLDDEGGDDEDGDDVTGYHDAAPDYGAAFTAVAPRRGSGTGGVAGSGNVPLARSGSAPHDLGGAAAAAAAAPLRLLPRRRRGPVWVPLQETRLYTLATKSYLAHGKDGFDCFLAPDVECLIDEENGPVLPTVVRNHFRILSALSGFKALPEGDESNPLSPVHSRAAQAAGLGRVSRASRGGGDGAGIAASAPVSLAGGGGGGGGGGLGEGFSPSHAAASAANGSSSEGSGCDASSTRSDATSTVTTPSPFSPMASPTATGDAAAAAAAARVTSPAVNLVGAGDAGDPNTATGEEVAEAIAKLPPPRPAQVTPLLGSSPGAAGGSSPPLSEASTPTPAGLATSLMPLAPSGGSAMQRSLTLPALSAAAAGPGGLTVSTVSLPAPAGGVSSGAGNGAVTPSQSLGLRFELAIAPRVEGRITNVAPPAVVAAVAL